jgi:hypothetical protein
MKSACKFPGARQALTGCEIAAHNAKNNLRDELLPDADFACAREPKLHGGLS